MFNAVMSKIPNITEQQSLLRGAFKRLVDGVGQKALVEAGLNQTVASGIYHGKKGIGDETIEKLDKKWPDWRETGEDKPANQPMTYKGLNLEFTGIAEFKRQLIHFFEGMSADHKEAIVLIANRLYEIDKPNDATANPRKRRQSDAVTFLGNVEPPPGEQDAGHSKDHGVQKQRAG